MGIIGKAIFQIIHVLRFLCSPKTFNGTPFVLAIVFSFQFVLATLAPVAAFSFPIAERVRHGSRFATRTLSLACVCICLCIAVANNGGFWRVCQAGKSASACDAAWRFQNLILMASASRASASVLVLRAGRDNPAGRCPSGIQRGRGRWPGRWPGIRNWRSVVMHPERRFATGIPAHPFQSAFPVQPAFSVSFQSRLQVGAPGFTIQFTAPRLSPCRWARPGRRRWRR